MTTVVDDVMSWSGRTKVAVGVNAHLCNLASRSETFRTLVSDADLRYPDGQSIVWALRLLGTPCEERVATTDLVFPLAARCAAEGKAMFLFGGEQGIAETAAERLRERTPGLLVETSHGFLRPDEMHDLVDRINRHGSHVVLVGLGDPAQQEWVARHRSELLSPAVLTCGGLFDWVSGRNRRPPDWMVRYGLEWLWRLRLEPRRLAARYLVGNPVFLARLMKQVALVRWTKLRSGRNSYASR